MSWKCSRQSLFALIVLVAMVPENGFGANQPKSRSRKNTSARAPNKKPSKQSPTPPKNPILITAEAGIPSYTFTESEVGPYRGYAFGGGVIYQIPTGSVRIGLGGLLHYVSISNNEGSEVTVSLMKLRPILDVGFQATPKLSIGGFFGSDLMMLSGKYSSVSEDGDAATLDVKSLSHTVFGVRGMYDISEGLAIGGQFGMGNGSLTLSILDVSISAPFKSQEISMVVLKSL